MALNRYSRQHIFSVFLGLLSVWGIVTTFQYGAASLDFYQIKNIITLWQEEGLTQSPEQYQKAREAVYKANQSHPNHPLYIDLIGQINEWGAIAGYEDQQQALQQAKLRYLQATKIRPTWPVTWASLAMVKWRLQEFDDEMLLYLNRADQFGPRKPEVNVLFSELGLALYEGNHPFLLKIRPQVTERLAAGLRNSASRDRVLSVISQYDAGKLVCRWLRDEADNIKRIIPNCKG